MKSKEQTFSSSPCPVPSEHYLTEGQVAKVLACSLSRLRQDRHQCKGIPYVKFGRSVRYAVSDVNKHMYGCRISVAQ